MAFVRLDITELLRPVTHFYLCNQEVRIEPPVYTDWGTWGQYSKCAPGHYVVGVQLRIEPDQGPDLSAMFDDTLTSLKL